MYFLTSIPLYLHILNYLSALFLLFCLFLFRDMTNIILRVHFAIPILHAIRCSSDNQSISICLILYISCVHSVCTFRIACVYIVDFSFCDCPFSNLLSLSLSIYFHSFWFVYYLYCTFIVCCCTFQADTDILTMYSI